MGQEKTRHHAPERRRRRTRSSERGKRAQIRKGLGACIFTLGIPLSIAGSIILIVSNTKADEQDVPAFFPVLGPVLLTLAIIFFAIGSIMTDMISIKPCLNFLMPEDPKHFCWKRCPRLFSILRPNDVTLLNRREAGLHALQSEPSKPVLKKPTEFPGVPHVRRGVRFSDSDAEVGNVKISVSSDPSETGKGDNSPSTSLLSLRHCKIYPKEGDKWGSMASEPSVEEEEGEGEGATGVVFTLSSSVDLEQDVFVGDSPTEHVTDIDQSDDQRLQPEAQSSVEPGSSGDGHDVVVVECEHF